MTSLKSNLGKPCSPDDARGNENAGAGRLQALRRYDLIDNAPEDSFDRITRLASALRAVPIAAISLIGAQRQWITSSVGIDSQESEPDASLCLTTIQSEDAVVVRNAPRDRRFSDPL